MIVSVLGVFNVAQDGGQRTPDPSDFRTKPIFTRSDLANGEPAISVRFVEGLLRKWRRKESIAHAQNVANWYQLIVL